MASLVCVNWVAQMALKSLKREQFRQSASSFRFFFPRSQSWLNLKNDTLILKYYSCLFTRILEDKSSTFTAVLFGPLSREYSLPFAFLLYKTAHLTDTTSVQ